MFQRLADTKANVHETLVEEPLIAYESIDFGQTQSDIAAADLLDTANETYLETRDRAIALKAAIETYGLTPALMAFANFNGALTEATGVPEAAALESLSQEDSDKQKEVLLATLESFIQGEEEPSLEFFRVHFHAVNNAWISFFQHYLGSIIGGPVAVALSFALGGGPVYLIDKIANLGKVYGTSHDIAEMEKRIELRTSILDKLASTHIVKSGESREPFVASLMAMKNDLKIVGIEMNSNASDFDKKDGSHRLWDAIVIRYSMKMTPFKDSGITAAVFKGMAENLKKASKTTGATIKRFGATLENVSGSEGFDRRTVKMLNKLGWVVAKGLQHDTTELGRSLLSAQRFFTHDKAHIDSSAGTTEEKPEEK